MEEAQSEAQSIDDPSGDPAAPAQSAPPLLPAPIVPAAKTRPTLKHSARLAAAGLCLGALSDVLLYNRPIGIGVFLFVACLCGALVAAGRWESVSKPRRLRNALPLMVALLFFAAMTAVRANSLLTLMNIVICVRLTALLLQTYTTGDIAKLSMGTLIFAPLGVLGEIFSSAAPVIGDVQSAIPNRKQLGTRSLPALRGILLAAPVIAGFVALLSSADAIFAHSVSAFGAWLIPADIAVRLSRVAFVLVVAFLAIGGIAYAITRTQTAAVDQGDNDNKSRCVGFPEGMIVLGSVCVVFATFVAIQFAYLFGGSNHVAAIPGLTYAAYAQRGFNELIWVALLTLTLLSVLKATIRREGLSQERLFNGAGTLLVGLTLVILSSAVQRMSAYEAAYGATETRVYADDFIGFIGACLIYLAATQWLRQRTAPTLAAGILLCSLGFAVSVDLQNPEATVIDANLARYRSGGKIDQGYIVRETSPDAVPALCNAFQTTHGTLHDRIGARLRLDLTDLDQERLHTDWPSLQFSKMQARADIGALAAKLPTEKQATDILGCTCE